MQDSTELAGNISEKVSHVTSLAEQSRDAVLSGREILQSNVDELLEIKNTNKLTIEGIKELNKKINSIWDIVSIINVVADQTKIIAFNAELEAASSGEAGKNFHIVATEIQKASDSLILDSEKGTEQINSGYKSVKSLESGFESILQSSENTAVSTHEILDHVSQLSSSSEQIFITLKQIAEGIENFSEFTSNISSSSENVRKIAGLL